MNNKVLSIFVCSAKLLFEKSMSNKTEWKQPFRQPNVLSHRRKWSNVDLNAICDLIEPHSNMCYMTCS